MVVKNNELLTVINILNTNENFSFKPLVDYLLSLENKIKSGRIIVPCLEGDLLQVEDTGEVILAETKFKKLYNQEYQNLKNNHLANSLDNALEKYLYFIEENKDNKVCLCFDIGPLTTLETLDQTVKSLKKHDLYENVFFNSFDGKKLDFVAPNYPVNLKVMGNYKDNIFPLKSTEKVPSFVTVPYLFSFGKISKFPIIYSGINSLEKLTKITQNSQVKGAYIR